MQAQPQKTGNRGRFVSSLRDAFRASYTPPPPRSGHATRLVVVLHAYTTGPFALRFVERTVRAAYADEEVDVWVPKLPVGMFSFADPSRIADEVARGIAEAWDRRTGEGNPYRHVTIVGHSIGALIGRKAYVLACGENPETPFSWETASAPDAGRLRPAAPWAAHVDRIVLLAAMNRGWTLTHHLSIRNWFVFTVGALFGNVLNLNPWRPLLISTIRRGAPFITELRLQWLSMRRRAAEKGMGSALVVQLLGTVDDLVSPEDNIDLVSGADFVYLDVPRSGHSSIRVMDDTPEGRGRAAMLTRALTQPADALRAVAQLPADVLPQVPNPAVNHVVFVIHGIRDVGYWTQRIARCVVQAAAPGQVFATETSSYGYFPMLSFLLPWRRRRKVEWLMDQYTEACALYPGALDNFHFVGHSNGTYLLARALADYPSCRFNRVVFAGSVVRRHYPWDRALASGRVKHVLNYVATSDWVVALFPKAFQWVGYFDIGSAGHDGFAAAGPAVTDVRHVRGKHDAALKEDHWGTIADFVALGRTPDPSPFHLNHRSVALSAAGAVSFVVLASLGALLVYGAIQIRASGLGEPERTLALIAYVLAVWLFVTRF
jgi:pimeloyl-ACP methyl ester carboxylesterase